MIKSPIARLSFGLALLTVSILLFAQLLGIVPDTRASELESRKTISESLAVQVSSAIAKNQPEAALQTLRSVVTRNASVISIGIRTHDNHLLVQAGNHEAVWKASLTDRSTPTHVVVPLFVGDSRWGAMEVHFTKLGQSSGSVFLNSFYAMVAFLGISGFIAYQFFLRRALRELNPDAVIPERVRTALNTLAEGVLIVDAKELIVFANSAFIAKTDLSAEELLGKPVDELQWELQDDSELPWAPILRGDTTAGSIELGLVTPVGNRYDLIVNASPISGGPNQPVRGVMTTFDDITELGKANDELRHALLRLESNEKEIRRQNRELQELATRDPLTGCLNRRSLFKGFDTLLAEAAEHGTPMSCIMVDIDYFKRINDKFGHGIGDIVIKNMAETLLDHAAPDDLVGRYGGEEFCLVLPNCDAQSAVKHAEKLRNAVLEADPNLPSNMPAITSSFGVCELTEDIADHADLVNRADEALYVAKKNGRNRVEVYGTTNKTTAAEVTVQPQEQSALNVDQCVSSDPAAQITQSKLDLKLHAHSSSQPEDEPILITSKDTFDGEEDENVATLQVRILELEDALSVRSSDGVLERVTGMPDRQLLLDRTAQAIQRAKRYQHHVVAMALNLDAFTTVRDALGEMAAEKFREIAVKVIQKTLRASDSVGIIKSTELPHSVSRLGSEQIGLLLTDIDNIELLPRIVKRLQIAMAVPQEIAGNEISLSADIGVSVYPHDSLDSVTLLRHATAAMNAASREAGRECVRYYASEINEMSKRRLRLETDLYRAIEREEFAVHYQPKVSMRTGTIIGMEALLRWNNPRSGLVPPDEFIPVAEQMGCINAISAQTIKRVCQQIGAWRDAGLGDISVAINLSPIEFHDARLANRILNTAESAGIDPALLEFEITESVVMENASAAVDIMNTLSAAGARISIDDFGTGYATLQCLTQFPISTIKIDRSFMNGLLHNAQDAAVVNGVTSLAHTMGLTVVAEGIEDAEQVSYLCDLQCDQLQGYYFSRPVPADEARELLRNPIRIKSLVDDAKSGVIANASSVGAQFIGVINKLAVAEVE